MKRPIFASGPRLFISYKLRLKAQNLKSILVIRLGSGWGEAQATLVSSEPTVGDLTGKHPDAQRPRAGKAMGTQ